MDQCEDREEGVPPSKSTLCGEHESQTKAQRNPPGPPPSSVSYESNRVKDVIKKFEQRQSAEKKGQRSQSAGSSCPSIRSDGSKYQPPDFSGEPGPTRINKRPESPGPEPSCVSLKSNMSKSIDLNFKGCSSAAERSSGSQRRGPVLNHRPGPEFNVPGLSPLPGEGCRQTSVLVYPRRQDAEVRPYWSHRNVSDVPSLGSKDQFK